MDLAKWLKKGKKQIQGVVAQVIPGGENYKSVVNNKPVNRPAPTYGPQQAPQQQFNQTPSFNKPPSINQNGRNRIGGIDIQAPTISKPEANKVDEVIRKQQRQSIQDLTDKFNRGEINKQQRQAAASATLTNDKTRAKPEAILRPKGIADNAVAVGMNLSRGNPITALQKAGKYADTLTNDTAIAPLGDLTNFLARKPAQIANLATGRDANSDFAKLEDSFADTNKMDSRIAKEAGNFAGMLGQTANFATAATAPIAFAGTVGDTGQQNFDELKAQGLSDNAAKGRSLASGVSQALIEKYSSKLQLKLGLEKMVAGSLVKGLVLEGGTEGLEEVTQKMVDNVATNKPMFEGVKEAATEGIKGGLMLGGTFGVVNHYGGNDTQAQPDVSVQQGQPTNQQQTTPEIQQQLQSPDPVVQQSAHDKLAGQTLPKVTEMPTAQGMVQRMRAAKQNVQKFNADLGQGGFIAGPLAGDFSSFKKQGKVFEGVDGKPRFEVSDEGAKLKLKEGFFGKPSLVSAEDMRNLKFDTTVSEVLDHTKLFEQYPELKDIKIAERTLPPEVNAQFNKKTNELQVAPRLLQEDPAKLKGTILHELQHAIQAKENFASGGSDTEFVHKLQELNKSRNNELDEINALLKAESDNNPSRGYNPTPEYLNLLERRGDIVKLLDETQDRYGSVRNKAFENYQNLAGEAEARAVAARKDMTDGERYKSNAPNTIEEVQANNKGVEVEAYEGDRDITLSKIVVDKNSRGGGKGTKAMKDLIAYADSKGKKIVLTPTKDYGGSSVSRLKDFYKQFGFVENKGKNKDFSTRESMYREPSTIQSESTFYDSLDVPKEDLIIRDGKGKAMSVEPDAPVEGKVELGEKVYHGTNRDFDEFDVNRAYNARNDKLGAGKAIYFSVDESVASKYANANALESFDKVALDEISDPMAKDLAQYTYRDGLKKDLKNIIRNTLMNIFLLLPARTLM
jgi:hypothetical protein